MHLTKALATIHRDGPGITGLALPLQLGGSTLSPLPRQRVYHSSN